MSMGMQVYLVDEAKVKAIPGCNDADLLADLLEREGQRESLAWFDEELADVIEDECPGFTHADALRDLFAGRVSHPEAGFVYVDAFEHVCSSLGQWVHNHFHRCNPELLTRFDQLFASHGVGLRFWDGLVGNPPVPLPAAPDGPDLGHWSEREVRAAAPAFRVMRVRYHVPAAELWFEAMLDEIGQWIAAVETQPGSMLVAVYA